MRVIRVLLACAILCACQSIPGPYERSMLPYQERCIQGDQEACATWNGVVSAITEERERINQQNNATAMIIAGGLLMGAAGFAAGAASAPPTTTYYYRRTTIYRRY